LRNASDGFTPAIARMMQPTTANDTALVARDPAETNSLRIVTRSRTRDVAVETATKIIALDAVYIGEVETPYTYILS
jgi:hypothetical protein